MAVKAPVQDMTPERVERIVAILREGRTLRVKLPYGGLLHIDRSLPFLCIYRIPEHRPDPGTARLTSGHASYLIASARADQHKATAYLVEKIAQTLSEAFGAVLLLEIWAGQERRITTEDPRSMRPGFVIHAQKIRNGDMDKTCEMFQSRLGKIRILKNTADARVVLGRKACPPEMPVLMSPRRYQELKAYKLGLEMAPIYRNLAEGEEFPQVLRQFHRGLTRAILQAQYEFTRNKTTHRPAHFHALGPRALTRSVWEIDQRLTDISTRFDFLLQVTPINQAEAWQSFKRSRFEKAPVLHYRPVPVDPAALKRKLYAVNMDRVEDPTIGALFREKRMEVDRQLTMLQERGTKNFLYGGLQLYGEVEESLMRTARYLLDNLPARTRDEVRGIRVDAKAFAHDARRELARFRKIYPEINSRVTITNEISGLMVSQGNLLIGEGLNIPANRKAALLQHEMGTHVLTYWNGRAQPFHLLASGLAGYEALQEGLAVLAEYMTGGLSRARLRTLGGRVAAAWYAQHGATFVETFRKLDRDHNFNQRNAYEITVRIYRGGGLIKDAIYLRGLINLIEYLRKGSSLELLWVGKIGEKHAPIIRELQLRGVLAPTPLLPGYFRDPETARRLARITQDGPIEKLLKSMTRLPN